MAAAQYAAIGCVLTSLSSTRWGLTIGRIQLAQAYELRSFMASRSGNDVGQRSAAECGGCAYGLVLEQQGGMSIDADIILRAAATAVADREHKEAKVVRKALLDRMAVIVARATSAMINRRKPQCASAQLASWTIARAISRPDGDEDMGTSC